MAGIAFFNRAQTTLAAAVTSTDATIQLVSGGPWASATGPFTVHIDDEDIRCSSITGNTLTVTTRGFDGSSPVAHTLTDTLGNPTKVTGALVRRDLQDAFVRLDTAASQTLTGPLVIPPAIGGTPAPTSYGSTVTKIDEQTPAAAASLRLPASGSLPTGFRNLVIRWKLRDTTAATAVTGNIRANADATNTYVYELIQSLNGTVTGSEINSSPASGLPITWAGASAPANSFGHGTITVFDYNSATDHKYFEMRSFERDGTGASGTRIQIISGSWLSAAAITFLTIATAATFSGVVEVYGEP